jgi:hypothetical protein
MMMLDFYENGLSCIAVVFGLFTVRILQMPGAWVTGQLRSLPDPVQYS